MKKFLLSFALLFFIAVVHGQYNKEAVFEYLSKAVKQNDKDIRDFLLLETENYLNAFPRGRHSAEVWLLRGQLLESKGKKHDAFAANLRAAVLFPQSQAFFQAGDYVRHFLLTEDDYRATKSVVLDYLEHPKPDSLEADLFFNYLELLVKLEQKKLRDITLMALANFVEKFPSDNRCERVFLWKAKTYALYDKEKEAEASFDQFTTLFPRSSLLPEALYYRGQMLTGELGQHLLAIKVLADLVGNYPQSEFAADALFLLGEIKSNRTKDYRGAVNDYGRLVEQFPLDKRVYNALWAIENLYVNKLKDYENALRTLDEIAAKDSASVEGIRALEAKAEIYKKKLKKPVMAAEVYGELAERYPEYKKSPDRLMEAAEICEKDNSRPELALEYYRKLVDRYPQHRKAENARKKIATLERQLKPEPEQPEMQTPDSTTEKENSYFQP